MTLRPPAGLRHDQPPTVFHAPLTELLGTKPAEIRALFRQTLEPDRVRQLKDQMLAAGLRV